MRSLPFQRSPLRHPSRKTLVLPILILLAFAANAAADEYYLLMFGSQRVPANPNYAHTFATFVKVCQTGPAKKTITEAHTISWLPANLKIRIGALLPEDGHNFGLHETLKFAGSTKQRVSLWGPYPIEPELYERALRRKGVLESGQVRYKADDSFRRDSRVTNCIHAVAAVAEGPRLVVISPGWGESASYFVLKECEPWILSKQSVPWVGSAIGLDGYPIIYRDFQNPRSNAVFGPAFRLLGGERGLQATYGPPSR